MALSIYRGEGKTIHHPLGRVENNPKSTVTSEVNIVVSIEDLDVRLGEIGYLNKENLVTAYRGCTLNSC